ncbi:FxSxx-COOH system tetratricopeptide repeat protein [Plantactinospora sp. CA-290183]
MPGAERGWVDLFVSYAGPDRPWAEWAAFELEAAGYSVELDVWDWAAGSNTVLNMNDALGRAGRVLVLYSAAYFERDRFTVDEWTAVVAERPDAEGRRRLVPVRVAEVKPPPILSPLLCGDLFGLDERRAREVLLAAVGGPVRPSDRPSFPGAAVSGVGGGGPRPPGSYPAVWNVPRRLAGFTGRESLLAALRQRLTGGDRALVQALHGLGGVGKTQLAVEYAYLFVGGYDLVWWIDAERADLIGEQVSALAVAADWVEAGTVTAVAADAVSRRLRGMSRWLIVFDNAEPSDELGSWLPPDTGHVIITSRRRGFAGVAAPVEVDVFDRGESVALLREYVPTLTERDADRLAVALGDLPLALAQAGGLMTETGMTVPEYLAELDAGAAEVLAAGKPVGYPVPLAAAVQVSTNRLAGEDPAAVQLLHLCAQLAPEPVLLAWFDTAAAADVFDQPLAAVVGARLAFRRSLGRLAGFGLARISDDAVQLHRLTQAVLRDQCSPECREADRRRSELLIVSVTPTNDGTDPASWPAWAALLPHLLALDPTTVGPKARSTACNALFYLLMRGEYRTALPLAETWHRRWRAVLGPDDHHVLWAANQLASAYRFLGHYRQAHELTEDILTRRRRVLGDDHPNTLSAANNLAIDLRDLGEHERARELDEDTLTRRRRVLGDDHPHTLTSAHNLAIDLSNLDEYERARALAEETLDHRRRVLGVDHPDTLASAQNLAIDLSNLGEHDRARALHEETLDHRRRVLGVDHPDTLASAQNLAIDLSNLGEHDRARALHEDTLTRSRRVLGDDHPDTLSSAHNLAITLRALREHERARQLDEDTLARRRLLDDDHGNTTGVRATGRQREE